MTEEEKGDKCIVVVRIRGTISARREVRETLQMLRLTRNNYAVLIDNRPSFLGMLRAVQSYVTWGEPSQETVNTLLKKKSGLTGDEKRMNEYLQKAGYKSLEDLAGKILTCQVEYWKISDVKSVFRLHPPSKGFKRNIKKSYAAGGELGYRGNKINELVERMT